VWLGLASSGSRAPSNRAAERLRHALGGWSRPGAQGSRPLTRGWLTGGGRPVVSMGWLPHLAPRWKALVARDLFRGAPLGQGGGSITLADADGWDRSVFSWCAGAAQVLT